MFDIIGKYNSATVYAKTVDNESYAQVLAMCNIKELKDCKIKMMPDMHAAEGCTVGTSMTVGDKINPSYVGSDIGCGMQVYKLSNTGIEFPLLDRCIRTSIPSGAAIHEKSTAGIKQVPLEELYCYNEIQHDIVGRSFGTLGGGNHFIEVDKGMDGYYYLIIHSGSRRLGKDVAQYHQKAAFFAANGIAPEEAFKKRIRTNDVDSKVQFGNCFLTGEQLEKYLHDMNIAVQYADLSRKQMGEVLINQLGLNVEDSFTTIHNYINTEDMVLRKGAVSAKENELLIIPINMRDGCLICKGKGNPDWNKTAPHGSGRTMKRSDAKISISLEEYKEAMKGIFSTSINESTIDESPMAYRSIEDIADVVEPTVDIVDITTPVYNFKASKESFDEETADGQD